jgi:SET domain
MRFVISRTDNWFTTRTSTFPNLPLTDDYPAAQKLLQTFRTIVVRATRQTTESQLTANPMVRDLYQTILKTRLRFYRSRRLQALPTDFAQAVAASFIQDGIARVVHQPLHSVSVQQLHANGVCIDAITVRRDSRLPHAGHGAFSTRAVRAGTVLTTSPLHHVPSYETWFQMYNFTTVPSSLTKPGGNRSTLMNARGWIRLVDEMDHMQLLYNYCFGHADSTLLLCPYGSGINYINHNRTLSNVRIAWPAESLHWMHNHSAVAHGTLSDLARTIKPLLSFSYVATRDIEAGEELYLDYGAEWEEAWQEHVATYTERSSQQQRKHEQWKQSMSGVDNDHSHANTAPDSGRYASAQWWNEQFRDSSIRTEEQQQVDPYPSNLQIRCHRTLLRRPPPSPFGPRPVMYVWKDVDYGLPCRILDRFVEHVPLDGADGSSTNGNTSPVAGNAVELYTIQLEWRVDDEDEHEDYDEVAEAWPESDFRTRTITWMERTDVPRSAIRFFNVPYSTDIHQSFAFRHEIGIPDEMFPPQWRNL